MTMITNAVYQPNTKSFQCNGVFDVSTAGVVPGSSVNVRGFRCAVTQFALMVQGLGTIKISPTYKNGSFETVGSGHPFANWIDEISGDNASVDRVHSGRTGGYCCTLTGGDDRETASVKQSVLEVGKGYTLTFWARGDDYAGESLEVFNGLNSLELIILGAGWQLYTISFVANDTTIKISTRDDGNEVIYVDDVSVTALVPFSSPGTYSVNLESSLDGVTWATLQNLTQAADATLLHLTGKPSLQFRFNVVSYTAAGDPATDYLRISYLGA